MQNILNGFMRYRTKLRGELLKKFEVVSSNPQPQSVIITCVDSRIVASRVTQTNPGETFVARNPGALVPNYNLFHPNTSRPEEAELELAVVYNSIDSIVNCGHSDCKAMNLVYENKNNLNMVPRNKNESVLKAWLMANSLPTILKYNELEKSGFKKSLTFEVTDKLKFEAYIDPENKFGNNDKFSQINTLIQLENLKYYDFLLDPIEKRKINFHALWLDIYCGDVYAFSFKEKRFLKLDDNSYEDLLSSVVLDQ